MYSAPSSRRSLRQSFAQLCAPLCLLLCLAALTGCGGKKKTARNLPPPPTLPPASRTEPAPPTTATPGIHVDPHAKAIWTQVGYASWYGPPYHNRRGANGEVYDQYALTAAHKTLPMNSIVRVVNLKDNRSTVVRITDRGPFIGDRVIDLSLAAAKAVGVYLPGTAQVRLDVLEAPLPIETGGRWCVQIGAFQKQSEAMKLKEHLQKKYETAKVLQFPGPTGFWVRVRVDQDDKKLAQQVYDHTKVDEGGVFLVRLD